MKRSQQKPDNPARSLLRLLGIALYHAGLARFVIHMTKGRIRALLYHDIATHETPYTEGLGVTVSPDDFQRNLSYFKKHYNVVSVNDLIQKDIPEKSLVITFDDGYESVRENAQPLLNKLQLPACIYTITRATKNKLVWVNELNYALVMYPAESLQTAREFPTLDQHLTDVLADVQLNPNDPNHCESLRHAVISHVQNNFSVTDINALLKRLRESTPPIEHKSLYIAADDIPAMQTTGIDFGFHTRDHYNLRNCTRTELQEQLDASDIQPLLNSHSFAYPFGYFDSPATQRICLLGYSPVMTVGNNNDRFSPRHLDRTEVFTGSAAEVFAQLEIVEPTIAWLRSWLFGAAGGRRTNPATSRQNV